MRFASIIHLESSDTILSVQNFIKEVENNSVIAWNIGDPSGEPNVLSYAEYKNKYLIPVKFIASEKRILHKPWHFNLSAQNIDKIYPESWLVDYTREDRDAEPGNEYTSDWHSLIMVFLPYRKTWRLCAFVSNHYTP